jgi:hypothetical protein
LRTLASIWKSVGWNRGREAKHVVTTGTRERLTVFATSPATEDQRHSSLSLVHVAEDVVESLVVPVVLVVDGVIGFVVDCVVDFVVDFVVVLVVVLVVDWLVDLVVALVVVVGAVLLFLPASTVAV